MTVNDVELRALMDAEAAAAEAADDVDDGAPLPAGTVSRPNVARSRVLQVRLNPEELAALEELAVRRGLPVSTIARAHLLGLIRESAELDPAAEIAAAADRIRALVPLVTSA
jgi:uncharacterized protein YbaP (TraB family)